LKARTLLSKVLFYVVAAVICLIILFPFYWTFLLSIKPVDMIFAEPPIYWFTPDWSTWSGLGQTISVGGQMGGFLAYSETWNSFVISAGNTALVMLFGIPAAYAFARYRFRGKTNIFFWFVTSRMLPAAAFIVPVYLIIQTFNLLDNYLSLILFYSTFNLPYVIWLMYGFFRAVPLELEEAAVLDGCSVTRKLVNVVLPNIKPGIVSTAFFCFIFAWNELLYSTILGGANTTKLIVPIAAYISLAPIHKLWPVMGAMTLVYVAPCVVGSVILRKYLIRGMAPGAVKE